MTIFRAGLLNVSRNLRRTTLTLLLMTIGVAGLIVNDGLIRFIFNGLRDEAIYGRYGHIQLYRQGYRARHRAAPFDFLIPQADYERAKSRLLGIPNVSTIAAELTVPVLLQSGNHTATGIAHGMQPVTGQRSSFKLLTGTMDMSSMALAPPVWLGRGMAERLEAKVGQIVSIMSATRDGSYTAFDFEVKGIFEEGFRDFDDWSLKLELPLLQKLYGQDDIERILIFVNDLNAVKRVRSLLNSRFLDGTVEFETTTWYDLADFYRQVVAMFGRELDAVKAIIEAIAFVAFVSFLAMSFTERRREMGVLLAMGMSRQRLAVMFLIESILLGLAGAITGTIVGLGIAAVVSYVGIPMPPPPGSTVSFVARIEISIIPISQYCLLTVAVAMMASLVPSIWIWRLNIPLSLREAQN